MRQTPKHSNCQNLLRYHNNFGTLCIQGYSRVIIGLTTSRRNQINIFLKRVDTNWSFNFLMNPRLLLLRQFSVVIMWHLYAVHDYFKHAGGRDIFLLDWRQVLSYEVSFLNIRIVVNSVINLVNKNLPRTALQICMFHFNYNFTIIVPNAFNYLKNVTTWEQCSVEL
jgi:hypothetical protein